MTLCHQVEIFGMSRHHHNSVPFSIAAPAFISATGYVTPTKVRKVTGRSEPEIFQVVGNLSRRLFPFSKVRGSDLELIWSHMPRGAALGPGVPAVLYPSPANPMDPER